MRMGIYVPLIHGLRWLPGVALAFLAACGQAPVKPAATHLKAFLERPPKGADADRWVRHAESALREIGSGAQPESV